MQMLHSGQHPTLTGNLLSAAGSGDCKHRLLIHLQGALAAQSATHRISHCCQATRASGLALVQWPIQPRPGVRLGQLPPNAYPTPGFLDTLVIH